MSGDRWLVHLGPFRRSRRSIPPRRAGQGGGPSRRLRFEATATHHTARGGCLSSPTVLGPGTDAALADHFHFDVKQRRGGYRICQ
ncbi:MAG: extensin family protein [Shimia sp.]